MRIIDILPRAGAVTLSVIVGVGIVSAILREPVPYIASASRASDKIENFIRMKRGQPVLKPEDRWTLVAGGDVMLSRFVATVLKRESVHYPYEDIRGLVSSADLAFANLENPVGPGPVMPTEGLQFRAQPETLEGLRDAGFDVLSIGNNHMSDAGRNRVGESRQYISQWGMLPVGAGVNEAEARTPAVTTVKGNSISVLAYGDPRFVSQVHFAEETKPGIARAESESMKEDIAKAVGNSDIVIVSLHAGTEYRETPDTRQQELLDLAAGTGVSIVLGHHPHVIQPLVKKGNTWVIGSLGNLVFDQMWSQETRRGLLLQFAFSGKNLEEIEAIPVEIYNSAQPRFAKGSVKTASLARLKLPLQTATTVSWNTAGGITADTRAMALQKPRTDAFTIERTLTGDLDGDRNGETFTLRDGELYAYESNYALWSTPSNWWVQDAAIADIDGKGNDELIISAWQSATDGSGVHNGIFIFSLKNNRMTTLWSSDQLARPFCEFLMTDMNDDGRDELAALEGPYEKDGSCKADAISIHTWDGKEFSPEWTSDTGDFWNLRSEPSASGSIILTNGSILNRGL